MITATFSSENEIWKDIPGYEGLYQASNLGRVKSVHRIYFAGKRHLTKCAQKEKLLKCNTDKTGYPKLRTNKDGKRGLLHLRSVIATLFVPNPFSLPCVKNKDGDKKNLVASNLEWSSFSDTIRHAYIREENQRKKLFGNENPNSRLVLDTNTGIFYDSIKEAAIAKNISTEILHKQIKGKYCTTTSLIFA